MLRTVVEFDVSSKAVTVLQLVNSNFADLMAAAQPVQGICLHRRHNRRLIALWMDLARLNGDGVYFSFNEQHY